MAFVLFQKSIFLALGLYAGQYSVCILIATYKYLKWLTTYFLNQLERLFDSSFLRSFHWFLQYVLKPHVNTFNLLLKKTCILVMKQLHPLSSLSLKILRNNRTSQKIVWKCVYCFNQSTYREEERRKLTVLTDSFQPIYN